MIGLGQVCVEVWEDPETGEVACVRYGEPIGPTPPVTGQPPVPTPTPAKTVKINVGGKDYFVKEQDLWIGGALVGALILILMMT